MWKGVGKLELDDRKWKIFNAIIKNYLETGEPVGSRTISKYTDLNLSSATIRNEMADLEEMGLIVQPHTSAGRIPSDKGYRLYVDRMMEEKDKAVTEMNKVLIQRVDRLELVLKQLAKLIANNTNYATMISGPQYRGSKLKFLQLSRVESQKLLVVLVVEGNLVKNAMIDIKEDISDENILKLNVLLNSALNGLSIDEINLNLITQLKEQAGEYSNIVASVLETVAAAIRYEAETPQIYTSGATNIFRYPELVDGENASRLISTLEEKEQLVKLLQKPDENGDENGNNIQVYIGEESPVQDMKDCSVITAQYDLGDGVKGTVGVIGPKRMDYEKVVGTLKSLSSQLDDIYKKKN
jgi:heat-inducible transcriptional repressor